jgi:hypothetical protein
MPGEAVLRALRHVWLTLEPLGVPMALAGGLALALWKHVRATRDVDLLVSIDDEHLDQVLQSLRTAGICPKRSPAVVTLGNLEVIQLLYEPPETFVDLQIDLLLAKSEYPWESLRRRVSIELAGLDITIAVLACEDLILHKLLAGRLIDRIDAVALVRANRQTIDLRYLGKWASRLTLSQDLAEVWREALPGEKSPFTSGS